MWHEIAHSSLEGVHGVDVSASMPYTSLPPGTGCSSGGAVVVDCAPLGAVVSVVPSPPSSSPPQEAATSISVRSRASHRARGAERFNTLFPPVGSQDILERLLSITRSDGRDSLPPGGSV